MELRWYWKRDRFTDWVEDKPTLQWRSHDQLQWQDVPEVSQPEKRYE